MLYDYYPSAIENNCKYMNYPAIHAAGINFHSFCVFFFLIQNNHHITYRAPLCKVYARVESEMRPARSHSHFHCSWACSYFDRELPLHAWSHKKSRFEQQQQAQKLRCDIRQHRYVDYRITLIPETFARRSVDQCIIIARGMYAPDTLNKNSCSQVGRFVFVFRFSS